MCYNYYCTTNPFQGSRGYVFNTAGQQGVSIAEALDDSPLGQTPGNMHHHDVSLRCVQVTAIGCVIEALQKRNIELASFILKHVVRM